MERRGKREEGGEWEDWEWEGGEDGMVGFAQRDGGLIVV
jgi:hypothetical protein